MNFVMTPPTYVHLKAVDIVDTIGIVGGPVFEVSLDKNLCGFICQAKSLLSLDQNLETRKAPLVICTCKCKKFGILGISTRYKNMS